MVPQAQHDILLCYAEPVEAAPDDRFCSSRKPSSRSLLIVEQDKDVLSCTSIRSKAEAISYKE